MTTESDSTEDEKTIEDQNRKPEKLNSVLMILSWCTFGLGVYLLGWAGLGWYSGNSSEAKLALATLLGILAVPVGFFLRKWAYCGLAKALGQAPPGVDISQQ
jgi:hypothetical protein